MGDANLKPIPGLETMREPEIPDYIVLSETERVPMFIARRECDNPSCKKTATYKCAACHCAVYCSRMCQTLDWNTHCKNCKETTLLF